jgi:hypothetical protein
MLENRTLKINLLTKDFAIHVLYINCYHFSIITQHQFCCETTHAVVDILLQLCLAVVTIPLQQKGQNRVTMTIITT